MADLEKWHYFDEEVGQWTQAPAALLALDELYACGVIKDDTQVVSATMARRAGPGTQGIPYSRIVRIPVQFEPTAVEFLSTRSSRFNTILAGPNNSGKTLFLRQLRTQLGQSAYFLQCNRFSHVDILNTRQIDKFEHHRYYDNFLQNYYTSNQNQENSELNLEQLLTNLSEAQLDRLFEIVSNLLGQQFSLKRVDEASRFSPYFIDMDGQNLRLASTGTRLLFALLGLLLDQRFDVIIIDEPEIGLSPRVQTALAAMLYHPENRTGFFSHLKQIYIATHSHLFLDRATFSNNHIVSRSGLDVKVSPVTSVSGLHRLQFNLLGNDLEAMSLPSAIVIVEGECDQIFLAKIFEISLPEKRISIVRAGGDGEILNKVNTLKEALGDIASGPYRDRLFAVLDARHSAKKVRLVGQGLREDHIRVWSRNGVEYLYPPVRLAALFRCTPEELDSINLEADPIEFAGTRRTKKALAQDVVDKISTDDPLDPELMQLVQQVTSAVS